ncbi:MAG: sigma-70 family RNA polymerase sigma factor [Polyangiaceae bacterium]
MYAAFQSDSLRAYRHALSSRPQLDRETERTLALQWKEGDKRAGERIVEACLPFVISIAIEYRRWGIPLEDIVQQGNVGLLRAAKKFDTGRECRLATYASYWIRAEIREYVVRAYRVVRLGTTKGERRALRAYRTHQARDVESLARVSGLSEERIEMLLPVLAGREASLEGTVNGGDSTMGDRLAATTASPEQDASDSEARAQTKLAVTNALRDLTDRELLIVRKRLMSDEPITLQALGEILGVSKERVRQLEERARGKLRGKLEELREHAMSL